MDCARPAMPVQEKVLLASCQMNNPIDFDSNFDALFLLNLF